LFPKKKTEQLETEKKSCQEKIKEIEKGACEAKERLTTLESELNDTRANLKAMERKNSQIVKDLQKQLQKEQLQKSKSDLGINRGKGKLNFLLSPFPFLSLFSLLSLLFLQSNPTRY
jgi:predicted  nucleic acid-binding Zn-ribbon protein